VVPINKCVLEDAFVVPINIEEYHKCVRADANASPTGLYNIQKKQTNNLSRVLGLYWEDLLILIRGMWHLRGCAT